MPFCELRAACDGFAVLHVNLDDARHLIETGFFGLRIHIKIHPPQ